MNGEIHEMITFHRREIVTSIHVLRANMDGARGRSAKNPRAAAHPRQRWPLVHQKKPSTKGPDRMLFRPLISEYERPDPARGFCHLTDYRRTAFSNRRRPISILGSSLAIELPPATIGSLLRMGR